jgi:MFS family permease
MSGPTNGLGRDRLVHGWLLTKGLSDAGDSLWTVALAWTAVHLASPTVAGLVVAAGTVPRAVVLLLGGVLADRADARRVMIAVNTARVAVLVAACAWLVLGDVSLPLLFGVAIAFGVCDAVYEPAAATIGRQLVRQEQLAAYAGAGQTISRVGSMSGAALGGVVVAASGIVGAAAANAVTFAVVVGYLALVLRPRYPLPRAESEAVLRGVARGFAHLRAEPTTRTLVATLSGLNLAVSPALALGVALESRQQGWGAQTLGALEALVGLGAAAGALCLLRWRPRYDALTGFAFLVVQGLAVAALATGSLVVTALACAVIGVTAGGASSLLSAVFVATVDGAYLGRMASIQRLGDDVLMPGAMAAFGALAGATGPGTACVVFGAGMTAAMAVPLSRPAIRSITLSPEPMPVA